MTPFNSGMIFYLELPNEIKAGVTPEDILEDKPYLTLASIYTAIVYYYDNKELLDAEFAEYDRECAELTLEYT